MVINILFTASLWLVCLYELIMRSLPAVSVFAPNIRGYKFDIALLIAIGFGVLALIKPNKEALPKWWGFLAFYLLVSCFMAAYPSFKVFGVESTGFWLWKPMYAVLVYMLFIKAVMNIKLKVSWISNSLSWIGVIIASYCIFQFFGIEQFFETLTFPSEKLTPTQPSVVGVIGQSSLVAPFLAMLLPIMAERKHWLKFIIVLAAIICAQSMMGYACAVLAVLISLNIRSTEIFYTTIAIIVISVTLAVFSMFFQPTQNIISKHSSGRIPVWEQTLNDVKTGGIAHESVKRPFTGLGLGSYQYLFPYKHQIRFQQAHNDYLQIIYEIGIVGFGLAMMIVWNFVFNPTIEIGYRGFYGAVFIMLIACLGTFPLHLGIYQYVSAVCLALVYKGRLK